MTRCLKRAALTMTILRWVVLGICVGAPALLVGMYVMTVTGALRLRGGGKAVLLVAAAIVAVVMWPNYRFSTRYFERMSSRPDATAFRRYTGPLEAPTSVGRAGAAQMLFLVDHGVIVDEEIPAVPLAVVDHAETGSVVFEIGDGSGHVVHRTGGYRP